MGKVKVPPTWTLVSSAKKIGDPGHRSCPTATNKNSHWVTAERMLLAMWLLMGLLPLALQTRSFAKFIKPHKMPDSLVGAHDLLMETVNITKLCPVEAYVLGGVWWNIEPTHYFKADHGIICHIVVPQYNLHGNYFIGSSKTTPYCTSPPSCTDDSYPFDMYLYHGSIGFYSVYEELVGTYCARDTMAYIVVKAFGTYDINGAFLADDSGDTKFRMSYWYTIVCVIWLVYRALVVRRSYISCKRYGRRCDAVGESIQRHEAMIFMQESLRLSAHGATNYQRAALLYLIVESIMTDLFLILANDGWATRVQYLSLGYNLSGLMLLLLEMLENIRWLSETGRLRIKRLFFNYETALVGEMISALVFQYFLTGINKSDLKRSKPTALAVSYYFWSLLCHGIVVVNIVLVISSIRVLWGIMYVWLKYRSFVVFSAPCCVDTALGPRSRLMMLGGYHLDERQLFYKPASLKSFGLLKMEQNGVQYLVLQKLHWFTVPRNNWIGIGIISGQRVDPCNEIPCAGIASFLNQRLGGASTQSERHTSQSRVMAWSGPDDRTLSSSTQPRFPVQIESETIPFIADRSTVIVACK